MILHSLTITGTGATVPLSSGSPAIAGYVSPQPLQAKWVQVVTPASNAANVLIGGNEVSYTASPVTSVGSPLPPGYSGQLLPPVAEVTDWYDLSNIYAYVASGDTLNVLYGG